MESSDVKPRTIEPLKYLIPNNCTQKDLILIFLNHDWTSEKENDLVFYSRFMALWETAIIKASVDGGMNILHKLNTGKGNRFIPDLLSGDFDSVEKEIVKHYKDLGTEIIHTPDQDYTDFTKCFKILGEKYEKGIIPSNAKIVVLGGHTDRFDHSMANINTLFTANEYFPMGTNIFLLLGFSLLSILVPGKTTIKLSNNTLSSVQLIPIQCSVTVSTNGFKQDLTNVLLSFDKTPIDYKVISENVTIITDKSLVLIISIAEKDYKIM